MENRVNAGYEIVEAVCVGNNEEIVLGKMETRFGMQYVTWFCMDKHNYCYGHYTDDYNKAKIDLHERVLRELRMNN